LHSVSIIISKTREDYDMKTILVSEIPTLDVFDIVKVIDDETKEFIGYFLHEKYQEMVKELDAKEGN